MVGLMRSWWSVHWGMIPSRSCMMVGRGWCVAIGTVVRWSIGRRGRGVSVGMLRSNMMRRSVGSLSGCILRSMRCSIVRGRSRRMVGSRSMPRRLVGSSSMSRGMVGSRGGSWGVVGSRRLILNRRRGVGGRLGAGMLCGSQAVLACTNVK